MVEQRITLCNMLTTICMLSLILEISQKSCCPVRFLQQPVSHKLSWTCAEKSTKLNWYKRHVAKIKSLSAEDYYIFVGWNLRIELSSLRNLLVSLFVFFYFFSLCHFIAGSTCRYMTRNNLHCLKLSLSMI